MNTLKIYKGQQHVGVIFWDYLEEASKALDDAAGWIIANKAKAHNFDLRTLSPSMEDVARFRGMLDRWYHQSYLFANKQRVFVHAWRNPSRIISRKIGETLLCWGWLAMIEELRINANIFGISIQCLRKFSFYSLCLLLELPIMTSVP